MLLNPKSPQAKNSGIDYLNYNNGYGQIEKECFSIDCYSQLI